MRVAEDIVATTEPRRNRKLDEPLRTGAAIVNAAVADAALLLPAIETIATPIADVTPLVAAIGTSPASEEPVRVVPATKAATIKPLDAERYKVQFTVNRETFERLRRVQDLMRHVCATEMSRSCLIARSRYCWSTLRQRSLHACHARARQLAQQADRGA